MPVFTESNPTTTTLTPPPPPQLAFLATGKSRRRSEALAVSSRCFFEQADGRQTRIRVSERPLFFLSPTRARGGGVNHAPGPQSRASWVNWASEMTVVVIPKVTRAAVSMSLSLIQGSARPAGAGALALVRARRCPVTTSTRVAVRLLQRW